MSTPSYQAAKPTGSALLVAVDQAKTQTSSFQPTHQHTRRGTLYKVIAVAKMQSAYWVDESESSLQASVDFRLVVVYQGEEGDVWVRPYDEFNDGRFEVLPAFSSGEA